MAIEKKIQCPVCAEEGADNKGDNLVYFDNGTRYCFLCEADTSTDKSEGVKKTYNKQVVKEKNMKHGDLIALPSRGISVETCVKYNYRTSENEQIANYCDINGQPVMQKVRGAGKKFYITGDTSHSSDLYGMHLFTPDERVFITITEGEIDALSVAQAFNCKYPVVSLPTGADKSGSGVRKILSKHLKYLQGFKYVVLAFDNDKPGAASAKACLDLFEPGKVRVVTYDKSEVCIQGVDRQVKDASDLLQAGKVRDLQAAIYNAVEFMPEPILTGSRLVDKLNNYKVNTSPWPWEEANNTIGHIHRPALYTIAAKPGVGKTAFVADIMRDTISKGGKVAIISLEESIQKVLIKMTSIIHGVDLSHAYNRDFTKEEISLCEDTAKNIIVYDHTTYGSDIETICTNIPHMVRGAGAKIVIFDNLSYSATGAGSNERIAIDQAIIKLKDSTTKDDYTMFNVCHLKRSSQNDDEESSLSAESIRGSGGIEMYSDYIIGLDRNTKADDTTIRNTLNIQILKDRFSGNDLGKDFNLFYNQEKSRLETPQEGVTH